MKSFQQRSKFGHIQTGKVFRILIKKFRSHNGMTHKSDNVNTDIYTFLIYDAMMHIMK